ncbi:hypothetical protein O7630_16820 [Micromonospora sp. WMMD718]|uniref:transmembrane-type terpene cyclase n=1 Tax=Micromonospora TaxID=1873 RepID=UPI00069F490B|nr:MULTISPECIES: hypothetical protein [unclassified Micromonospora]MDG4752610.1 hypothetical protein [Micromonospora sp. WMMD718]WFF05878.1 hypothetical protein O7622_22825 [Micromonospora sp. WMMD1076]
MDWLPPALVDLPRVAPSVSAPADFRNGWFWAIVAGIAVFWILAYGLSIQRAFVDKAVGIPVVIVAINFAWEFVHSFVIDQEPAQRPANFVWFFVDIVIVTQVVRYGHRDFPRLSRRLFRRLFFGLVAIAAVQLFLMAREFRDILGMYSGCALNVGMSAAFIVMLVKRRSSAGQSVYAAICKMVGSQLAGLNVLILFPDRYLVLSWFVMMLVLDIVYVRMLYRQIRAEGQSPWNLNRPPVGVPAAPVPAPRERTVAA